MEEDEGREMTLEEMNYEVLECSRYGEVEDLRILIEAGADVNFQDSAGNSALHKAAANGEVECLKVLKSFGAIYNTNLSGNLPIHWAVQNQKLEAVSFLLENYEVDVLQKNSFGRSVLTDAFQTGNTDIIALCLSHSSSSEERLLSVDKSSSSSSNSKNNESSKDNENSNDNNTDNDQNTQVIHEFDLNPFISALVDNSNENQLESTNNEEYRSRKTFKVRELPITRADNPFGGITTPEDDTTGLSIWPSAILMARYAIAMKDLLKDKVVMELGCGCGVPGLAVARYCEAKTVYLTDIHQPTIDNLQYNIELNHLNTSSDNLTNNISNLNISDSSTSTSTTTICKLVNWCDSSTYPPELADVLIGSDLIYDVNILKILVPAVSSMLREGGHFLYVAPDFARAGMADLVSSLAAYRIHCINHSPAPPEMFQNPLASDDGDQFVLHFYDLSAQSPHSLFHFIKLTDIASSNASNITSIDSSLPSPPSTS